MRRPSNNVSVTYVSHLFHFHVFKNEEEIQLQHFLLSSLPCFLRYIQSGHRRIGTGVNYAEENVYRDVPGRYTQTL